jgi:hypothetical protein
MPNLPIWVTPHPILAVPDATLLEYAKGAIDHIIYAVTQAQEEAEETKGAGPKTISFTGKDYADAHEAFNKHLLQIRAGDGLPLIPPTKEKVEWMLIGTNRSPDDVVVTAHPSGKSVTVEGIAINVVMAGAIPAYMPVIIAALEAWDEYHWGWSCVTTTGACAPFVLVSGPIVEQLDVNSKGNCLSGYGWRANTTIGRSLEMIFHTIGGAIPGITDMSMVGMPHTIISIVLAERKDVIDELGWPTYSEERGFTKDQNTIAVATASMGCADTVGYGIATSEEFLTRLVEGFPILGGAFAGPEGRAGYLILTPEMARLFAEFAPTKAEAVKVFLNKLNEDKVWTLEDALEKVDLMEGSWWARLTEEEKAAWGNKEVRFFSSDPFEWAVLVAGGPGKGAFHYPRNLFERGQSLVMKEIELPANWDEILDSAAIEPILMP